MSFAPRGAPQPPPRHAPQAPTSRERFGPDQWEDKPRAVKTAAEAGIELAFSHPSFDLRLLLHFQPFGGAQGGSSKLEIEKLRQATDSDAFKNYDKGSDKSIRGPRRDALKGRADAVAHARRLAVSCSHSV
ncbi:RloB domain-containing protein [Nonomuraea sp. NPDC004186]